MADRSSSNLKSYNASYDALCKFFAKADFSSDSDAVIQGVHMVYGWMPTIINLTKSSNVIDEASGAFNQQALKEIGRIMQEAKKAKREDHISENCSHNIFKKELVSKSKNGAQSDFEKLVMFVNNSVVGSSKVLHFCNPEVFPICDSKIQNKLNLSEGTKLTINVYKKYLARILKMSDEKEIVKLKKLGFVIDSESSISKVRQIELQLFEMSQKENEMDQENEKDKGLMEYFKS